jgi:hypothetical protein
MSHESKPSESLSAADPVSIPVGPHAQTLPEGTGPGSHDHTTFYEQLRAVPLWANPYLDDRRHEAAS